MRTFDTHRTPQIPNEATWATFDECLRLYEDNQSFAGIGFVFTGDDPFIDVDLDDCRNAGGAQ